LQNPVIIMYSECSMDTSKNQKNNVEDAEIVEQSGPTSSLSLIELTTIINRYIGDMDKVKNTLKEKNSIFKDTFENDAEYHELNLKVKEINKVKNGAKQRILKTPAMEALTAQINEQKSELKDMQDMMSGYLEQYQKVSGTNIIETENGDIREIVPVYRLVKRKI